jgi:signal peptidase
MQAVRRHLRGGIQLVFTAVMFSAFAGLVALGVGPRTGWYRTLTVLSGSMTPRIPVGALVLVTPESPTKVRVGQVVTYQIPVLDHHVISHRVVKVISGGERPVLQTKGDANAAPDPWTFQVTDAQVWHMRTVLPGIGSLILVLRKPWLHKAAVVGIPALIAIEWIFQIWKEPSRKAEPALEGARA